MSETPDVQAQAAKGPPYIPTTAALGGQPTVGLDVPVCAVFLALFVIGAVSHMSIFLANKKRSHKFVLSGMLFGFCMARITTMVMRIVWACKPKNTPVAIAASVFVAAGVVLLFVINLLFAQRILRAQHPHIGWHIAIHYIFIAIYVLIVITLIMLITAVVTSFYTLNPDTHRKTRDITLYGGTFYAVIAFLPIPIALVSLAIPRRQKTQKFGKGRFRNKLYILLVAATLLCLGAAFRVGTNYLPPKPRSDPPAYFSKACFYIFNFTVEIIVVLLYVVVRVDKRFWVPNGSHAPGDYLQAKSGPELLQKLANTISKDGDGEHAVCTEEELFAESFPEKEGTVEEQGHDVEKGHYNHGNLGGTTAVATPVPAHVTNPATPRPEEEGEVADVAA